MGGHGGPTMRVYDQKVVGPALEVIPANLPPTSMKPLEITQFDILPQSSVTTDDQSVTPSPFTIWSPRNFFDYKADESSMLLGDGFIEKGEWTSLVGAGGLGKSRLVLWFCICQITGRDWCGLNTRSAPQKCLLLSPENSLRRWKTDLQKMYLAIDEHQRDLVDNHLRALALTPDDDANIDLWDMEAYARLEATLKQEDPGIIIFDPFADMMEGDENSAQDVGKTLKFLRKLHRESAPRAAVIIVHHARTGKANVAQAGNRYEAGNFARGSKALFSKVRCELQLAPGNKTESGQLVLACGKSNNTESFKTRGIIFNPDDFSYTLDHNFDEQAWRDDVDGKRSGKSVSITDVVSAVRELVENSPNSIAMTGDIVKQVSNVTAASERTIKTRLKEALGMGYLQFGGQRGAYKIGEKTSKVVVRVGLCKAS